MHRGSIATLIGVGVLSFAFMGAASADDGWQTVRAEIRDSPRPVHPVLENACAAPRATPQVADDEVVHINHPKEPLPRKADLPVDPRGQIDGGGLDGTTPSTAFPSKMPAPKSNYAGISFTRFFPPDPNLACGPQHVVLVVNTSWAAYRKSDGGLAIPAVQGLNTFFGAVIAGGESCFDPKVIYDSQAGRWVLVSMAVSDDYSLSSWLLAVSKTSDPTGDWYKYRLDGKLDGSTSTGNWADFPGVGVDGAAIYLTANMFAFDGTKNVFQYCKIRLLRKSSLYAGAPATWKDITRIKDTDGFAFTVQPAQNYDNPTGNYLISANYGTEANEYVSDKLTLWKITNPTGTPKITKKSLSVRSFTYAPDAVQKGGGDNYRVATNDHRLLNAVSRGGKLYTVHTIGKNWGSGAVAAIRWYEITAASGAVSQTNDFGKDKFYYFFPAVMPDAQGNLYLAFNRSSSTEYAGIRYTGRKPTAPANQLDASVGLLISGKGTYAPWTNRWGDYNGIAWDPADPGSVWIFSEYAASLSSWGTQFGHIGY